MLLTTLGMLSCGGHRISSWAPSGSLEWDEAAVEEAEGDAGGPLDGGEGEAGEEEEAVPPMPEDPATALARADRLFAAGDAVGAARAYGVVFATGERYQQAWSLYRIAWCAVTMEQLEQAVERIGQLLGMLEPPRDDSEARLRRDAVHDLALFESMRGDVEAAAAVEALAGVLEGEELQEALRTLADQYRAAGRLEDETVVRGRLGTSN